MIYQKLAKIQAAVKGLTKDTKAYSYKYVDGNKCLASIRPLMVEYGLLLMPEVREISTKEVTYKVWNDKAKSLVDKTEVLVTIKMQMTWVDSEDGEMLRQEWAGTGMNDFTVELNIFFSFNDIFLKKADICIQFTDSFPNLFIASIRFFSIL